MTPEKQRIAIAEACPHVAAVLNGRPVWRIKFTVTLDQWEAKLFDPLTDLNAMHEAEKAYFDPSKPFDPAMNAHGYIRCMDYDAALAKLTGSHAANYHATAAQRAEAFLRTIGKWED
jgi:hypothetical protein